ncbi:MAG: ABC transporter ATP-binding protein/permease [Oscillospiraceae bacterium]|nr:ABC transporter ATP-binding protein/permease [Oscillospiraceae bacterium]
MPPMPRGMGATKPKSKNAGKTLKRILGYLMQYKLRLLGMVVCIIASAYAAAKSSLFLKTLIDDYITPMLVEKTPDLMAGLIRAILLLGVVFLVGVVCTFLYNRIMIPVGQGILKKVRDEMFAKMETLPIRYFDVNSHGDIMSHYTNDTDTLRQLITMTVPQLVNSVVSVVVLLVSMLSISFWMTLLTLAFTALNLFISGKTGGLSGKYFITQQRQLGDLNGYIEEMINGQKVVKVFNHEQDIVETFDKKNTALRGSAQKAFFISNLVMPIIMSIGYLQYVALAVAGAAMAIAGVGGVTLGGIVSFLQLSKSFNRPIDMMSQQISAIVMALAGAERIFELMDQEPEQDGGTVKLVRAKYDRDGETLLETDELTNIWAWRKQNEDGSYSYRRLVGDIVLNHVDFGYNDKKQILYDINIQADAGQKIAFVGHTGAGKTTITNLLNRFYDIQGGTITYDGIDITHICKSDLRRSLGVVLQDVNLFTGTVMENIRYGRLDATDEECIAAAQLANADNFIRLLPQGYDTVLSGDGAGLSQGQRQLIAIARAAVADPPVMILDEATSSIDTRTESIVQKGMDSLMYGRTVFVIAHRLSTVQNSDVIMVIDGGHIIERGNHDKLIAEKGQYYRLYTGAFELE